MVPVQELIRDSSARPACSAPRLEVRSFLTTSSTVMGVATQLSATPSASGVSILYALGTTIFGGTTQFVVAWLIERTGSPMVPA